MASKRQPYRVAVPNNVVKQIKKLPREDREALLGAIEGLAAEPRPPGSIRLKVRDLGEFRLRVGRFRVFYDVDDGQRALFILAVKPRNEKTYKPGD